MANLNTRKVTKLARRSREVMQVIPGKSLEFTLLLMKLKSMRCSFYVESGVCCQKVGENSVHSLLEYNKSCGSM